MQDDYTDKCFVVMPFGFKPFRDGSSRTYDFDKVYRIIIQRAIRQAGMQPIRADETIGSAIIHGAMFKDLRDQPVVLADLSLDNPNVFYELGIRHVMSSSGTVLICAEGSALPFDINLSRVIFYKYDGQSLDWEEVERVVEKLQVTLQQARRGEPDSPVHALLETIFKAYNMPPLSGQAPIEEGAFQQNLVTYQELVATYWQETGQSFEELDPHRKSIFGARALGYYCLKYNPLPEQSSKVAAHLADAEQYDLSVKLFSKLQTQTGLAYRDTLRYASAISELNPDLPSADRAIELVKIALRQLEDKATDTPTSQDYEAINEKAFCYRSLDGLYQWRWQLTKHSEDLQRAIDTGSLAINLMAQARTTGNFDQPGQIAQAHLRSMLLLRAQANDVNRIDVEGHRDAILSIKPSSTDKIKGISYLNWYQALTLADSGEEKAAREKAVANYSRDAQIMNEPDNWEIGRRQYVQLRRFIEQYFHVLRNSTILGGVSQIIQIGHNRSIKSS